MASYHLGQMTSFYDTHIMIQNPSASNAPRFSCSTRNIRLLTLNTHAQEAQFESQSNEGREDPKSQTILSGSGRVPGECRLGEVGDMRKVSSGQSRIGGHVSGTFLVLVPAPAPRVLFLMFLMRRVSSTQNISTILLDMLCALRNITAFSCLFLHEVGWMANSPLQSFQPCPLLKSWQFPLGETRQTPEM